MLRLLLKRRQRVSARDPRQLCLLAFTGTLLLILYVVCAWLADNSIFYALRRQPEFNWTQFAPQNTTGRSAIIYLANQERMLEFTWSLQLLFDNFNSRFRYPVIVFYDDKFGQESFDKKAMFRGLRLPPEDKALIVFEYLNFSFPIDYGEVNIREVAVWPHTFPGYQHMIAFWSYHIFHHPRVRGLEYFWRLDTDSYIFSRVEVDFIEKMRLHGYHYGYRSKSVDPPWAVKGLSDFVEQYSKAKGLKAKQVGNMYPVWLANNGIYWFPTYYNNFELVHVPTFLRPDMEDFRLAFFKTKRIYTHRWGDAPQRYIMVNMFLNKDEVYEVCECPYEHQAARIRYDC